MKEVTCTMRLGTDLKEERITDPFFPIDIYRCAAPPGIGQTILHLHWHEHFEIIYLIEGEAVFYINGQENEAKPGDLLFVGGGELHTGRSATDGPTTFYAIVFHPNIIASTGFDPHHSWTISPLLSGKVKLPTFIPGDSSSSHYIADPIRSLVEELLLKQQGYEMQAKLYLSLVFTQITRHYSNQESGKDSRQLNERFKPLITYLEQHYADRISVEDAAQMVNLSPYHFCKTFKKATGYTFSHFVQLIRISEAERRLLETELTITEIATEVGFCDIQYFNKVFKRTRHCSPSEIRKKIVNSERLSPK